RRRPGAGVRARRTRRRSALVARRDHSPGSRVPRSTETSAAPTTATRPTAIGSADDGDAARAPIDTPIAPIAAAPAGHATRHARPRPPPPAGSAPRGVDNALSGRRPPRGAERAAQRMRAGATTPGAAATGAPSWARSAPAGAAPIAAATVATTIGTTAW